MKFQEMKKIILKIETIKKCNPEDAARKLEASLK